eukprot:scaffold105646_cov18-Tisochrysis_lutea.AAC.1
MPAMELQASRFEGKDSLGKSRLGYGQCTPLCLLWLDLQIFISFVCCTKLQADGALCGMRLPAPKKEAGRADLQLLLSWPDEYLQPPSPETC